ncbi:MAG: helix-turn-helix domain-containing protein [Opitutaceae bacterium]|nr:helix-turn-helix domain-containing protein [Verrucomicrobiales bacterium]
MSTVAEQLREAREAQQLTVHQVAEITKMRTDHVRALEEGNYNVFSAPVYIRGSVRTYAALLKLPVPKIMEALDGELSKTDKHNNHPPLTNQPRNAVDWVMYQLSRVNWRIVLPVLILVVVLVGGYWTVRLWQNHKSKDPLSNLGPGVYKAPARSGGETLPLPPARR